MLTLRTPFLMPSAISSTGDVGELLDGGEDDVAQEGGARTVRLLMSPPPQVLVATICRDKLNDGTGIVRAVLEDNPLKDIGPVAQDQRTDQLVDEGLCDRDPRKVQDDITALGQRSLRLVADRDRN
jgi:hypothetical protein